MKKKQEHKAVLSSESIHSIFRNLDEVTFSFPDPIQTPELIQACVAGAQKGAWLLHLIQKFRSQCSPKKSVLMEKLLSDSSTYGMQRILELGAAIQIHEWHEQKFIRPEMNLPEPEAAIDQLLKSDANVDQSLLSKVMRVYHDHFGWMGLDPNGADTLVEFSNDDELADAIARFLINHGG